MHHKIDDEEAEWFSGGISWSKLGEPYNSETDYQIWHDCVL